MARHTFTVRMDAADTVTPREVGDAIANATDAISVRVELGDVGAWRAVCDAVNANLAGRLSAGDVVAVVWQERERLGRDRLVV